MEEKMKTPPPNAEIDSFLCRRRSFILHLESFSNLAEENDRSDVPKFWAIIVGRGCNLRRTIDSAGTKFDSFVDALASK